MKSIPPKLIPLVENHLKELKKRGNQISKKPEPEKRVPDFVDADGAQDITVSFWELGGHPDLIPVLHPFITGEVNLNLNVRFFKKRPFPASFLYFVFSDIKVCR